MWHFRIIVQKIFIFTFYLFYHFVNIWWHCLKFCNLNQTLEVAFHKLCTCGNFVPFLLAKLMQLDQVCGAAFTNPLFHFSPQIFCWIKVATPKPLLCWRLSHCVTTVEMCFISSDENIPPKGKISVIVHFCLSLVFLFEEQPFKLWWYSTLFTADVDTFAPVTSNIFTSSMTIVLGCFWTCHTKICLSLGVSTCLLPKRCSGCVIWCLYCLLLFVRMNVAPFKHVTLECIQMRNQTCGSLQCFLRFQNFSWCQGTGHWVWKGHPKIQPQVRLQFTPNIVNQSVWSF